MKRLILACAALLLLTGCVYHGQAAKKTAARLSDRSVSMRDADARGQRDSIPSKYFEDNVEDSALNEKELGEPKERTDISDAAAVAGDQAAHKKEQAVKAAAGIGLLEGAGVVAGLLGFGGIFLRIKSAYDTVKKAATTARSLYDSSIKGVEKYKDEFESVVDALPIDKATKDSIHEKIGRAKINDLLSREAMKTGFAADHVEAVNRVKSAL